MRVQFPKFFVIGPISIIAACATTPRPTIAMYCQDMKREREAIYFNEFGCSQDLLRILGEPWNAGMTSNQANDIKYRCLKNNEIHKNKIEIDQKGLHKFYGREIIADRSWLDFAAATVSYCSQREFQ